MSKLSSFPASWSISWSGRVLGALCLVVCLLSACGYQLTAQSPIDLPQNCTRLFLRKVTNPTTETWLEPMLRTALRDEFTRRGKVTWVDRDEADALVSIDVHAYSTSDAVKGRDDVTIKSKASIQLEVSFAHAVTGALIWTSGPVLVSESYHGKNSARTPSGVPVSSKREATQEAVNQAMRQVADRLSQKF